MGNPHFEIFIQDSLHSVNKVGSLVLALWHLVAIIR